MKRPMQSADKKSKFNTRRLTLCAILCAAALTIFVVEAQIPLPIAFPGVKLGLSNVITLIALLSLGVREAFAILIARILLAAIFVGQPSILLYSLSGGIVCLAVEALLLKVLGKKFICEISIVGAMVHNTVQILCAAAITRSVYVFGYLPPLLILGAITGVFCGICTMLVYKSIKRDAD